MAKVKGVAEGWQPHTHTPPPLPAQLQWPLPAQPSTEAAVWSRRIANRLFNALGFLGVLFSSIFSFLQNFVNELCVDFGADMDRDAHQTSGRTEILKYV